ncbi:MFS transporter [Amorphus sp. MBR-141]
MSAHAGLEEGVGVDLATDRKASRALFAAGFTVFELLYFVQSLLPIFAAEFHVSPAESSLTLSGTTGVMGIALLLSGIVSDGVGRKRIMVISLVSSSLLTIAMAFVHGWGGILGLRILMGLTLSGVQGVAMAYLAEESDTRTFGTSLGLFISGSAIGGMVGRLAISALADHFGWRAATAVMGLLALAASIYFWRTLPASRNFVRTTPGIHALMRGFASILRDRVFLLLFAVGFLLMGSFVTTYNYITFRLLEPPFSLSHTVVGLVFLVYLTGIVGSPLIGGLSSRLGPARVLWAMPVLVLAGLLLTLPDAWPLVLLGLAILTFGFFSGHSVASGWVSRRASQNRALAASLYLFAYYQGSSLLGTTGGVFWQTWSWAGVCGLTAALALTCIAIALYLRARGGDLPVKITP